MPVVTHYAVAAQTHIESLQAFGDDAFKSYKVGFLPEYTQTAVGTVEGMIYDVTLSYSF